MVNERLWHLGQNLRRLQRTRGQSSGLWDDARSREIDGRYLRPHDDRASRQQESLTAHDGALERVSEAARDARVRYEESRIAGDRVGEEISHTEYAVTQTYSYVGGALTEEGKAAEHEVRAVTAAQQADASGTRAPGEHGQTGSRLAFTPHVVAPASRTAPPWRADYVSDPSVASTLGYLDAGTVPAAPLDRRWGTTFNNREGLLPGGQGANSPYREYRVTPPAGTSGAGATRIVVNSDNGATYYTSDHYASFSQIR